MIVSAAETQDKCFGPVKMRGKFCSVECQHETVGAPESVRAFSVSNPDSDIGCYGFRVCPPSRGKLRIVLIHSCQQKSIGLKFSMSQTGNDVRYSCHHNSSRFTFPIFAHSCRFSVLHSLQSITPRIY